MSNEERKDSEAALGQEVTQNSLCKIWEVLVAEKDWPVVPFAIRR